MTSVEELHQVEALRRGEEGAFVELVNQYAPSLLQLARCYVPSRAVAEEVVQETWLGVLQGIHRFEARSSLKTWIFRILVNRAIERGKREGRVVSFSSLDGERWEGAVDPSRFMGPDRELPDHWAVPVSNWGEDPETRLLSEEAMSVIQKAIAALPASEQVVVSLRDVEGWTTGEVSEALGVSDAHQRVLLHRGRSRLRRTLEQFFEGRSS
jgi:RNA polymerase sigma-70 factor (ECF subfamily)